MTIGLVRPVYDGDGFPARSAHVGAQFNKDHTRSEIPKPFEPIIISTSARRERNRQTGILRRYVDHLIAANNRIGSDRLEKRYANSC